MKSIYLINFNCNFACCINNCEMCMSIHKLEKFKVLKVSHEFHPDNKKDLLLSKSLAIVSHKS